MLNENKDICEKQILNFQDLMSKLIKCKSLLNRERLWNIFLKEDHKNHGYLNIEQTIHAFKNNTKKVIY